MFVWSGTCWYSRSEKWCKFLTSVELAGLHRSFYYAASFSGGSSWQSVISCSHSTHCFSLQNPCVLPFYSVTHRIFRFSSALCYRIMQAMLDRLIPLFLDYLFVDYKRWVDEEALGLGVTTVPLSHALESSSSSRADCQPLEISS